jgi:hypothetical protein
MERAMFEFSERSTYQMPAHFGGQEGPPVSQTYHDVTSIAVSYETDGDALAQYIPGAFQLTQPVVTIVSVMNRGVDWMAGGGYNAIGVNAPVAYVHGQERLLGHYSLVMWENKTCPILGGREQCGIGKIFANIEDPHQLGDRVFTNASYEGSTFLRLDFRKTGTLTADELSALNRGGGQINWFGWRYIPNIGRSGAALSHATLYPVENTYTAGWRGTGKVCWEAVTAERHPAQAHIIWALSQLPIKGYRECVMTVQSQVLRIDIARQLA